MTEEGSRSTEEGGADGGRRFPPPWTVDEVMRLVCVPDRLDGVLNHLMSVCVKKSIRIVTEALKKDATWVRKI